MTYKVQLIQFEMTLLGAVRAWRRKLGALFHMSTDTRSLQGSNSTRHKQASVGVDISANAAEGQLGCWVGKIRTVHDEGHEGGHGVQLFLLAVLLVAQGVVDGLVHLGPFILMI